MPRVLLIEDGEHLGESVMRALQARGHDVIWAKTVKQAQACYGDGSVYNAVVCDYELPDGTGLDFYLWAAEHAPDRSHPYTTWILWSGLDRREEADAHEVHDMLDYVLVKDFDGQATMMQAVEAAA